MSSRSFTCLLIGSLCFVVMLGGCGGKELSLNLKQGDITTYKSTIESFRIIKYEGPNSEISDTLKDGQAGIKIEMVFSQQIEGVDKAGNANANITIKQLKYHSEIFKKPSFDFDSTAQTGRNSALTKLIGSSYKISIGTDGKVASVIDTSQARAAIKGAVAGEKLALYLLRPDQIMARHSIAALPSDKEKRSEKWSNIKSFNLNTMGVKSYERIYTLKKISGNNATIEMNGIPSSKLEEGTKESVSSMNPMEKMFDNVETYTGQLVVNLDNGKIEKYFENLDTKWIMVMPAEKGSGAEEPDVMTMNFINNISLEKVQ